MLRLFSFLTMYSKSTMYVPNLFSMLSGTYPNVGSRCSGFLAGEGLYLRRNQSDSKRGEKIQRSEKIKVATAAR